MKRYVLIELSSRIISKKRRAQLSLKLIACDQCHDDRPTSKRSIDYLFKKVHFVCVWVCKNYYA